MTWLVFLAAQAVLCVYLIQRTAPGEPRWLRLAVVLGLAGVFAVFNLPWVLWAVYQARGIGPWRLSREPWALAFLAWQFFSILYLFGIGGRILVSAALRLIRAARGRLTAAPPPAPPDPVAPGVSRRDFLRRSAWLGGYAIAGTSFVWISVREASGLPVVREIDFAFDDLPAEFDGYRILQLTDVHSGWHMSEDRMAQVSALVTRLEPDLVAVTGDLIDWNPRDVAPYARAFMPMRARDGVVCVLGNHDYYTGVSHVIDGAERAGHLVLRNEHRVIARGSARLVVAGIEDPRRYGVRFSTRDPQRAELKAALRGAPADAFRLVLAHRPDAFLGSSEAGVPLTLAGHTHGGQVAVPGWSLARLATPFDRGRFAVGKSRLYVCPGIGMVGVPIRIGVPPELALIRLRRSAAQAAVPTRPPSA